MITELSIRNFKCFRKLDLELGALTVLTGRNSGGKSTALQPLLLLAQAFRTQSYPVKAIPLNGDFVRLGSAGEVISAGSSNSEIEFELSSAREKKAWTLKARAGDRALHFVDSDAAQLDVRTSSIYQSLSSLTYIGATRLGTPSVYPMPDFHARGVRDVGADGRFAAFQYDQHVDDPLQGARCLPGTDGDTVRRQVDQWMDWLFPGASVNVQSYPQLSLLGVHFRVSAVSEWRQPTNVGYGYSYVFPIVVSVLTARKGQTILIDSPEAHLHPRAQSHMGRLLAKAAQSGVQVLVETHSDHVLNGMRLGIRDGWLNHTSAKIHFFSGCAEEVTDPAVVPIDVSESGRLSQWPKGFFDQIEEDLAEL